MHEIHTIGITIYYKYNIVIFIINGTFAIPEIILEQKDYQFDISKIL